MTDPRGVLGHVLAADAREQANSSCLGQRLAPLDCCHCCSWVRALVAIPLVAPAASAQARRSQRCWVAPPPTSPDAIADEASAGAEPDDPPDRAALSSRPGAGGRPAPARVRA